MSTSEQTTERGAGAAVIEALLQGEGGDRHGTANYAISYLIINGDKCHEEVRGALTEHKPGYDVIWRRRKGVPEEMTFKLKLEGLKQELVMDWR